MTPLWGSTTPPWDQKHLNGGPKEHNNGQKVVKGFVTQIYFHVARRKVKKISFGAFGANEKITLLKKPVSLARAILGHTGLGLNDNRGHVR